MAQDVVGTRTNMAASRGEHWLVPCDSEQARAENGQSFDEWLDSEIRPGRHLTSAQEYLLLRAWEASRQRHTASLRRVGWLDQQGRVWTEVPPSDGFDGGSLTPLLIDVRE